MSILSKVKIAIPCVLLIIVLIWLTPAFGVASEPEQVNLAPIMEVEQDNIRFRHLYQEYSQMLYNGDDLHFPVENSLIEEHSEITITVNVPETAVYALKLDYFTLPGSILPTQISLEINGESSFYELRRLELRDSFVTEYYPPVIDRFGNELTPVATKADAWQTTYLFDPAFFFSSPLGILLEQGQNELKIRTFERPVQIGDIALTAMPMSQPYQGNYEAPGSDMIAIRAEQPTRKNDLSIRSAAEFNVDLYPYDSSRRLQNILNGSSFSAAGQRVDYDFYVENAGHYFLAFHYRQNNKMNFFCFRQILINGVSPYEELNNVGFLFNSAFTMMSVENEIGRIPVYLHEGLNTISLVVSLDTVRDTLFEVQDILQEMNALTVEIRKLVGIEVDRNRDFEIERYIPQIQPAMLNWAGRVDNLYNNLMALNPAARTISEFAPLRVAYSGFNNLARRPNQIPNRMNEFTEGAGSINQQLATLYSNTTSSEISLDMIYFYQEDAVKPSPPGVLTRIFEALRRFILSFEQQNFQVDFTDDRENLQVWVNRSRQYVEVLQRMIDLDFTPSTGIQVDLSIMPDQNRLILANAAGNAPDIGASVSAALPFELAIRDALVDLRKFDSFNEVASQIPAGMFIPGVVGDGIFAMPETFDFYVLFYRTDILDSLNLQVPDSLEDVKNMLPEMQRRGMNFFSHLSGFIGMKPFAGTVPFIYQHGGDLFAEDSFWSGLYTEESIAGLREMTDLYIIHNIPFEIGSFYQHFRDGTLPLGVSNFAMYMQLLYAAPEIADSWDIALFPGIYDEESGEVLRYTSGAAETLVIFDSSNKQDDAWRYIEWWLNADTQVDYANNLQASYGREFMWAPANTQAFRQLPWQSDHREVIVEMQQWIREPPRVPGIYMSEREISNAFNRIVLEGWRLRSTLYDSIIIINREMERRMEEFGYMQNGEILREYQIPSLDLVREWIGAQ